MVKRGEEKVSASCGSLFPLTRANAQWFIHGFSSRWRTDSSAKRPVTDKSQRQRLEVGSG